MLNQEAAKKLLNPPKPIFNRTMIGLLLGLLVLLLIFYLFSDIVLYLVISLVITSILRTPTNYISQFQFYGLRIPRVFATLISFMILLSVIGLFIYLFVPLVQDQVAVISRIDFKTWTAQVVVPIEFLENLLLEYNIVSGEQGFLKEEMRRSIASIFESFKVGNFLNNLLGITGSFLVGAIAVSFITFFLLYEKGLVKKTIIPFIPNKYFEVFIAAMSKIERLLSNYLLGLLLQMVSIFSIASFGLLLVGIEYAVTIAVFAAVANLIPFLGPILGASFGLIVGLSTGGDFASSQDYLFMVTKIVSVFAVVQLSDNLLLQPLIFSKSVKAHPLEIFLIVFVGASLANAVGMIAAIPAYTIIKVSAVEFFKGLRQYQVFRS